MRELATILGSKLATSIEVNGLFVPANSITTTLQSFVEPALFCNPDFPDYGMTKSGSLAKVKVGGRYFALVSRHQLTVGQYEFDQLAIHNPKTRKLTTSHRAVFETDDSGDSGTLDCVLFEFTDSLELGLLDRRGWYEVGQDIKKEKVPKAGIACSLGYPSHANTIDYEANEYAAGLAAIWGEEIPPKLENRLALKPVLEPEYSPKGMSGGPVFGIEITTTGPCLFFAGIVTNASAQMVHFTPSSRIRNMFEFLMPSTEKAIDL